MKLKDLFEAKEKSVADLNIDCTNRNDFKCNDSGLTSLEGSPKKVAGLFNCTENELTSLKGGPEYVGDSFLCSYNMLTSLEGAPKTVYGNFRCYDNQLTSLKDVHRQIHEITGLFDARSNLIKSHVLGLLLIKGITEIRIDNIQVEEILNRHIGKGRAGMLQAQEELIEASLEEYAQL